MEWVETVGKTVGEATEAALDVLGIDETDVEIIVLELPRAGLFGLRRSEARVRARVRPAAPRPKRSQRGRRREPRSAETTSTRRTAPREQADSPTTRAGDARGAPAQHSAAPGAKGRARKGSEERALAGNQRQRGGASKQRPRPNGPQAHGSDTVEESEMSIEEQAETVGTFVAGVVERFGLAATTGVRIDEEHIVVDVQGEDLGLLVGPRGSTLDAFQELSRTMIQRRSDEHAARVVLDVAGFRAKRAAALESFAQRVAREVLETGEPEALEPMSPADRRVVHDAVNALEGVETASEGVEPRRYVVISATAPMTTKEAPAV